MKYAELVLALGVIMTLLPPQSWSVDFWNIGTTTTTASLTTTLNSTMGKSIQPQNEANCS